MAKDLKIFKENISLFDLLNIPSIRDSLLKSMIIKQPKESQNNNIDSSPRPNYPKPGSKGTPPFLLTFEIFNRNVHNCMVDSGASSNVMPLSVCKNMNATWEACPIQIVQLDRSKVKVVGRLKNVLLILYADPRIH